MEDYQARVILEKKDLDEKIERLETFTFTETFKKLDGEEKDRMLRQLAVMKSYSSILRERIVAFVEGTPTIIGETK